MNDKEKKLKLIKRLEDQDETNYDKYIKAKDYISAGSFWQNDKENLAETYFKICLFYLIPFSTTAVFSVLLYPRAVFVVKKLFKLKSFFGINLGVIPILLFFNVRVFALTQTYVGFKIIQSTLTDTKTGEYGKHYRNLANKILTIKY